MRTAARYIGLVGSRRKVLRLLARIARAARRARARARLYAPVGLASAPQGPEEIAVSIAAELVALRRGASAPHLRACRRRALCSGCSRCSSVAARRERGACERLARRRSAASSRCSTIRRAPGWRSRAHGARAQPIYDVLIVGAGQGGLAAAFGAHARARRQPAGRRPEPARSRRALADLRAHAHAAHAQVPDRPRPRHPQPDAARLVRGAARRGQLGDARASSRKELWAAYLRWYRRDAGASRCAPDTRVGALRWDTARARLARALQRARTRERDAAARGASCSPPASRARATGTCRASMRDALPASALRAHARRTSTSTRLRGKRVAVLGAGASAFDNAATALEHGRARGPAVFPAQRAGQRQRLPLGGVRRLPEAPRRPARRRQVALHPADPAHGPAAAARHASSAPASTRAFTCTPGSAWTLALAARGEQRIVRIEPRRASRPTS